VFDLDTGNLLRQPNGAFVTLPAMSIANPDNVYVGPINYIRTNLTQGTLDTAAVYAFDTLEFNPQWMLNLGARYEHNEGDTVVDAFDVTVTPSLGQPLPRASFDNTENLFSWRAAAVYKPVEDGTI
jgi:catecholate siderophore receptor